MSTGEVSELLEKQQRFARLLGELLVWIYAQGWAVTLADGSIDSPRKFRDAQTGVTFSAEDAHHKRGGLHYKRLAQDLNLFVGGEYIADGGHPVWAVIGTHWEGLNPDCRWGGRFNDANHVSIEHEGRA